MINNLMGHMMKFEIGEYKKRECTKTEFVEHHKTLLKLYREEKAKAKMRHEKQLKEIEKKIDRHIEAPHAAEKAQ